MEFFDLGGVTFATGMFSHLLRPGSEAGRALNSIAAPHADKAKSLSVLKTSATVVGRLSIEARLQWQG